MGKGFLTCLAFYLVFWGPKIRPKGVVDGQQVNIPVLSLVGPEGPLWLAVRVGKGQQLNFSKLGFA